MMNVIQTVEIIKGRFAKIGHKETIPLLKGGHFIAEMTHEGVSVNNLGNQPLLPWAVFQEAVSVVSDTFHNKISWLPGAEVSSIGAISVSN